jgi:hypothetical protein
MKTNKNGQSPAAAPVPLPAAAPVPLPAAAPVPLPAAAPVPLPAAAAGNATNHNSVSLQVD